MATWQAEFKLEAPFGGFPEDLADRFGCIAAPTKSWDEDLMLFGDEHGHRIDLWCGPGTAPEVTFRVDLRATDLGFVRKLLALAARLGARIHEQAGAEVAAEWTAMQASLHRSPAFRFVTDPHAYLNRVRTDGVDAG